MIKQIIQSWCCKFNVVSIFCSSLAALRDIFWLTVKIILTPKWSISSLIHSTFKPAKYFRMSLKQILANVLADSNTTKVKLLEEWIGMDFFMWEEGFWPKYKFNYRKSYSNLCTFNLGKFYILGSFHCDFLIWWLNTQSLNIIKHGCEMSNEFAKSIIFSSLCFFTF